MAGHTGVFGRVGGWLHRYFLWLLVGSYLFAAVWPAAGTAIRHTPVVTAGEASAITLPMLLLAFLLFNAGLASDTTDLIGVVRRPLALFAGVAATVVVPLIVVGGWRWGWGGGTTPTKCGAWWRDWELWRRCPSPGPPPRGLSRLEGAPP